MRQRLWIHYGFSFLGLVVGLWGIAGLWQLSGLQADDAMGPLTDPIRVGDVIVGSAEQLIFEIQTYSVGAVVEIGAVHAPKAVTLVRRNTFPQILITAVVGLFFIAVNVFVFCSRIDRKGVRDFYWSTLLFGIAVMIGGFYVSGSSLLHGQLRPIVLVGCSAALPLLFLHVTLTFPRRRSLLDRHPKLIPMLWGVAILLVILQSLTLVRYVQTPTPGSWSGLLWSRRLAQLFLVVIVAAGCLILYSGYRRLELTREREQTKWLLWGIALGVTPFVFLRTLPGLFGVDSPVPREVDHLFELAIPVAFAFAVFRYKFLDIDVIIRRSLIYTVLAVAMVGIYLFLAVLVGRGVRAAIPAASPYVPMAAVAVAVALFQPTRQAIGRWVDQTFFKIRYNYAQSLGTLKQMLPRASSQKQLADMLGAFLQKTLQPKTVGVIVPMGGQLVLFAGLAEPLPRLVAELSVKAEETEYVPLYAPNSTSLPESERADFPAELAKEGSLVVTPLRANQQTLGWILLGEKRSERRYIIEDLELLREAALEASFALERIRLVQQIDDETKARQRLDEMNRLKSDFLSRVSHDLRTPLTSITWSTQNLLDGVLGTPNDRQKEYLEAIRTSANQLGRLVHNLVEISRLELSSAAVEPLPIEISPVLQEAVTSLKPIGESRQIDFDLHLQEHLPPVRGDREKIFEILTNLLENAIRYSPDKARIEISVEQAPEKCQKLTVRDHGPGLGEGEGQMIFERFAQGKPSPYTQQKGFGLGLFVVRSYMQLFGGEVAAANHSEGGAEFVCTFRCWDDSREDEA